jgi:hypothetical protein
VTACACIWMLTGLVIVLTIRLGHIPDLKDLAEYAKIISGFGGGTGAGTYGFNQLKHLFGSKEEAAPVPQEDPKDLA